MQQGSSVNLGTLGEGQQEEQGRRSGNTNIQVGLTFLLWRDQTTS